MDSTTIAAKASALSEAATALAGQAGTLSHEITNFANQTAMGGHPYFLTGLTVLVLAIFVGYHVVWSVTPALHSPLMAVTNAISSVIIVGALVAAGPRGMGLSKIEGFIAVLLASINIFGGFIVTERMLAMFRKKK
ncbi:MAG TPA: hypothetical protein DCW68_07625 [Rhodospirillaceae bacterium]|nr:MAG: hypothetical protein A2018_08155 [Alphaproteobacteria bacterium GWF2_58_20]HAU29956.1 hypothetical protein [Rhodospirillaceae bacterium]